MKSSTAIVIGGIAAAGVGVAYWQRDAIKEAWEKGFGSIIRETPPEGTASCQVQDPTGTGVLADYEYGGVVSKTDAAGNFTIKWTKDTPLNIKIVAEGFAIKELTIPDPWNYDMLQFKMEPVLLNKEPDRVDSAWGNAPGARRY